MVWSSGSYFIAIVVHYEQMLLYCTLHDRKIVKLNNPALNRNFSWRVKNMQHADNNVLHQVYKKKM